MLNPFLLLEMDSEQQKIVLGVNLYCQICEKKHFVKQLTNTLFICLCSTPYLYVYVLSIDYFYSLSVVRPSRVDRNLEGQFRMRSHLGFVSTYLKPPFFWGSLKLIC